ncbi:MAG: amidohydrolase family protein [Verrucomicrobiales bacterium]|nr:amidohydrolase family protein [Verrucomicrobiales bacterium]
MRLRHLLALAPLAALPLLLSTAEDEPTISKTPIRAYTNATLHPVSSAKIDNATLVVWGDTILAAGPAAKVEIPPGAERIDCSGKTIIPGLVCTHSHIGQVAGADSSSPIQPDVRVLDSIDVRDTSIDKARAGGITTANLMPGSGHLLSGQTIYLKLRKGNTVEDLAIKLPDGSLAGGVKMANGTNSIRDNPWPGTRGKSAALVRQQFLKAQAYQKKRAKHLAGEDPTQPFERDLALETLADILDRKRTVHHHTHRHDDILTVIRLKQEFGFDVVLHHVSEAWKVADEIAAADVPCSIIFLDSPGGKLEARDLEWRNGAELEKRGVLTAMHTDDPINDSRWFLRNAAIGIRAGMSPEKALEALTLAGAKMLGLDATTGSLDPGKQADFVILSGDPFSVYTRILETHIEGEKVFDLANPTDRLFAEGGYGAGHSRQAAGCCFYR